MIFLKTLRRGDRGAAVEMLQLALFRSGYLRESDIDGVFGVKTENAVRAFQAAFALSSDGIVGVNTWEKLQNFLRGYFEYTVKRGDTLYQIAKNNLTTVRAIRTANPSLNPDNLLVGGKIKVPFGFRVVAENVKYTYELVRLISEGLAARYPFITLGNVGKSVMGRDLLLLTMGTGQNEVFINASHHANEWITTPLVLKFLENYAAAYSNFDRIYTYSAAELFRNSGLFLMPLVNPDGVDLVNGEITGQYLEGAREIAASFPNIPFPSGWKANIVGDDLNLNYPALWDRAKEVKYSQGFDRPAPRDYVGAAPLAAKETRAVYDFTNTKMFDITISYHTQGKEIYYEFQGKVPPRGLEIGTEFARVSGYRLAAVPPASSYAGYKDWVIQDFNVPSYTIEAGAGANPLPITQLGKIYNDNVGIMAYALSVVSSFA